MDQLNNFEYLRLSSPLPEIVSNKMSNKIKFYFLKLKKKVCVALLLSIFILIIICFLKFSNSLKVQKSGKIKRSASLNNFKENQGIKTFKINTKVIPQNRQINRRPHVRFTEKTLENDSSALMNKLDVEENFSSKPFDSKINKYFAPSSNSELSVRKPKERSKIMSELLPDLSSPMRLKGVYIKPQDKMNLPQNHLKEKYFYSKEINNLMQNNLSDMEDGKQFLLKRLNYMRFGAPFQLPTQERKSLNRQVTQENFRLNQIFKKYPVTIYLEFYPVKNLIRKFGPSIFKQLDNTYHTSETSYSFSVEKLIPSKDKQNRMIMKLNLYPKESNFSLSPRKGKSSNQNKMPTSKENHSGGYLNKKKRMNRKNVPLGGQILMETY